MTKKTRDTLYEYVYLTSLESNVARHPLFIRLHYIHQNSFTYLTYPTAHMQRHPHSLGTMHVAGEMFANALKNTNSDDAVAALVQDVKDIINSDLAGDNFSALVNEAVDTGIEKLRSSESVYLTVQLSDKIGLVNKTELKNRRERTLALLVLLQATRLAALVHDVGHPPFSHIVEYGLQSALPDDYSDHEKVGIELSELIFSDITDINTMYSSSITNDYPVFCKLACSLAIRLLDCGKDHSLYAFKTSVLSGDFDADRIDYVRRDIESTGMTATTYDLGRILDGLHIHVPAVAPGEIRQARIAVSPKVLSSIETFFTARFHLYRWAIFHHDVTRRNYCMQRFVHLFLSTTWTKEPLRAAKERFKSYATDANKRRDYKYFTDGFFVEVLWIVFDYCEGHSKELSPEEKDLFFYCDIVLNRNNSQMRTLWKRPDHYHRFCTSMSDLVPKNLKKEDETENGDDKVVSSFNRFLKTVFEAYRIDRGETRELARYSFSGEMERLANESAELPSKEHRLFVTYNASFKANPSKEFLLVEPGTSAEVSVENISPMVGALRSAWEKSPQLMVFFKGITADGVDAEAKRQNQYYAAVKHAIEQLANKYGIVVT